MVVCCAWGHREASRANGRIYTTGNVDNRTVVSALDFHGKPLWQTPNGRAWKRPKGGSRATPTIDHGRLYHRSPHGDLVCLDAETGEKIWGTNILKRFGAKNIEWGLAAALLIDGDRLVCCPGGLKTAVVALDKNTGDELWRSPSAGDLAGYCSPILAEHQGLRIVVVMTARAVIGVNADVGDLLFRFEHVTPFDENILMPIVYRGYVFITSRTSGAVMLKLDVDGRSADVQPV